MYLLKPIAIIFLVFFAFVSTAKAKSPQKNATDAFPEPFRNGPKCNQTEFEDHFGIVARYGRKKDKFPENQKMLNSFCKNMFRSLKKLDDFKKNHCYSEMLNSFISVLVYSIRVQMRRTCTKRLSQNTAVLLETSPCLNRYENRIEKCMISLNKRFIDIRNVENRLKMPYICCEYVHLLDCLVEVFTGTPCQSKLSVAMDQVGSIMGNFVNSYCGDYGPETDKCTKLPALKSSADGNNSASFIINLSLIFEASQLSD